MGDSVDDEESQVSPETEAEIRDAMREGASNEQQDSIDNMAKLMRRYYVSFRARGFSRKQAFTFTALVFQRML